MSPFWAQWYPPSDVDEQCLDLQSESNTWCCIWIQLQCTSTATFLLLVFWHLHFRCFYIAILLICIATHLHFLFFCNVSLARACNLMRSFSFAAALLVRGGRKDYLYFILCQYGCCLQFNEIILICSCIVPLWWSTVRLEWGSSANVLIKITKQHLKPFLQLEKRFRKIFWMMVC